MRSWDFIFDTTEEGKTIKILSVVDESSRFSINLNVNRKIDGRVVLQALDAACVRYGGPRATSAATTDPRSGPARCANG